MFLAPCSITKNLDRIVRNFLWHKDHLVGWKTTSKPKEKAGLGICGALYMNKAFLTKWWWRFNTEGTHLWFKIVKEKYGLLVGTEKQRNQRAHKE